MIPALSLIPIILSQPAPDRLDENMDDHDSSRWHKANGWSNGDPFNCGWRGDQVDFNNGIMTLQIDNNGCPESCSNRPYAAGEYRTNQFSIYFGY